MLTNISDSLLLKVIGLKKHFPVRRGMLQRTTGWIKAVDGVDFIIEPGKTLGLVGESGCGKSTVARLLLRLLAPDAGEILFRGNDLSFLSEKQMRPFRKEIQIVFQDPYGSLNPRMTAGQAIEEGLRRSDLKDRSANSARLKALLRKVGLSPESADRFPHEFSGGQRQRIGIARALSVNPSLIVCDEPVSALDVSIQAQIINLLKDLQDDLGVSYLFISHDLNVVGYLCHTVSVMYRGRIMEHAPCDAIFDAPRHPYTRALLAAGPDATRFREPPVLMTGERAGEETGAFEGCEFQEQCAEKTAACGDPDIPFVEVGEGHYVRCKKFT
ncbi:MAG: oligopeptide/dipeptide ABC transporter ATP-binding protein [Pseudomonadota bacterium]